MTTKEEVAALMASEGDYEKKLSLLKKAVVNVMRQKQEAEAQNLKLQDELRTVKEELQKFKEGNLALNRRVATLEGELERDKKKANFGQNVLKGLTSLVGGSEESGDGGAITLTSHAGGKGRGAITLRAADAEKLVKENENLLMQVYHIKNNLNQVEANRTSEEERHRAAMEGVQRELRDLQKLLETTTKVCDSLNGETHRQRALVQFCHYFCRLRLAEEKQRTVAVQLSLMEEGVASPPTEVTDEAARVARGHCISIATLLHGISLLLSTLQKTLPRAQRATVGDIRIFGDRLATLTDAHCAEKVSLSFSLQRLQELLDAGEQTASASGRPGESGVPSPSDDRRAELHRTQQDVLDGLLRWLGVLRQHTPLLVDACVSYLPQGQSFSVTVWTDDGSQRSHPVPDREVFVEEVTACLCTVLASLEGSLEALKDLLATSESALTAQHGTAGMLVAMVQFWWEGAGSLEELRIVAASLATALKDIAEACNVAEVSRVLSYVGQQLCSFTPEWRGSRSQRAARRLKVLDPTKTSTATTHGRVGSSPNRVAEEFKRLDSNLYYDEVLNALSSADRAAVCYHTQMTMTLVELAEKEDALHTLEDELRFVRAQLEDKTQDADRTRDVMQQQIELLSKQLTVRTIMGDLQ